MNKVEAPQVNIRSYQAHAILVPDEWKGIYGSLAMSHIRDKNASVAVTF